METRWRSVLLTILLTVAHSLEAGRSDCKRREKFETGRCRLCPTCPAGRGLPSTCGWGAGAGLRCDPCPEGFFNPSPGGMRCGKCRNCTSYNRKVAFKCRTVIDAECGSCLDGYYDEHRDVLRKDTVYPCSDCRHNPHDEDCKMWRLQVESPVTNRLQAVIQRESTVSVEHVPERPRNILVVLLGCACLVVLVTTSMFLIRHRRAVLRFRGYSSRPTRASTQEAVEEGRSLSQVEPSETDGKDEAVCGRHLSSELCMAKAEQASPWCPVLTLRPEVQPGPCPAYTCRDNVMPHRKRPRYINGETSPVEDENSEDEACSNQQSLLDEGKLRKRPRVTMCETLSDPGSDVTSPVPGLTITIRHKRPASQTNLGVLVGSNSHHCTPHHEEEDPATTTVDGKCDRDPFDDTDTDEEDDAGLEADDTDMNVLCEFEIPQAVVQSGVLRMNSGRGSDPMSSSSVYEEDVLEGDLQQYGACAAPSDGHVSSYVDFQSSLSDDFCGGNWCDVSQEFPWEPADMGDLSPADSDPMSQGSMGNISQASTILIRGRSDSPLVPDEGDFLNEGPYGNSGTAGDTDSEFFGVGLQTADGNYCVQVDTWATTATRDDNVLPITGSDQENERDPVMAQPRGSVVPVIQAVESPEVSVLVDGSVGYSSGRTQLTDIGPAPRHLAALTESFSHCDVEDVETAEAETEMTTRMIRTLDEERYAQALRLANDHLVDDLDFDIRERLTIALQPRLIPGDRNFRHLAVALGLSSDVIDGLNGMSDVLTHLRRRRVPLASLLRALRVLTRLDVLYVLCVWVLDNFLSAAPPVRSDCPLAATDERTQAGSGSEDRADVDLIAVQETIRWQ